MKFRYPLLTLVMVMCSGFALAQRNLVYNHYFLNPFLYNPSYIAPNGYTELYLNYRKQWAGVTGAPTTGTLNLQLPMSRKVGLGFTAYQDDVNVLRTTTALLSFGYQVYLGKNTDVVHKLAFGISAGVTFSYIPLDKVENGDSQDDALSKNNTSSMDGQFGVHYQLKNLKLSFALPRLFRTYVASQDGFNQPSIEQVTSTLSSVSYNFQLSPKLALEPFAIYRTEKGFPSQYEALGVLKFSNIAWAGGSYRQDYGASAFLGFNIKDRYKVGYAYEFAPNQSSSIGNGTHEFQLVVRLGKKKDVIAKASPVEQPVTPVEETVAERVEDKPLEEEKPADVPVETQTAAPVAKQEAPVEQKVTPPVVETSKPVEVAAQEPAIKDEESAEEKDAVKHALDAAPLTQQQKVAKAKEAQSLYKGHYVVVGAFHSAPNAKQFMNTLKGAGYPATMSYIPEKNYYVVHMGNTATIDEARELRNEYRRKSRYSFKDTWILSVE